MKAGKIILWILILGAVGLGIFYFFPQSLLAPTKVINNSNLPNSDERGDLIIVDSPKPNETIVNPVTVTGTARGNWYFEASFPITLQDSSGLVLAQGIAAAQGDWMTEDFVPFTSVLNFITTPTVNTGELVLHKDNPSGLPEYEDKLVVPVKFDLSLPLVSTSCIETGCSNQVCADQEVTTTCDFNPAYVCYSKAVCERQSNSQCGWTETIDLKTCLEEFK